MQCCISKVFLYTSESLLSNEWQVWWQSLSNAATNTLLCIDSSQKTLLSVICQFLNPHGPKHDRHPFCITWKWWDNAPAQTPTTSVGRQPAKRFYWFNMVMNSLSEYSLVWSLTKRLEEIDFVQLLFLIKPVISSLNESVSSVMTCCHWECIDL